MARRVLNISDADKAEMLRLYISERNSLLKIGQKFNVSSATVARVLRSFGASIRKRGSRSVSVSRKTAVDSVGVDAVQQPHFVVDLEETAEALFD